MASSLQLDGIFRALADPTRRAVVHRLGAGPASVQDLAAPFDMALPSFLKHISVLEDSGLIASKKTGRVRTCRVNLKRLVIAESWIREQRELWEDRTDRLADFVENLERKEHS